MLKFKQIGIASFHYYRAPENIAQNKSLLTTNELITIDKSIIPLNIGEKVAFDTTTTNYKIERSGTVLLNDQTIKIRSQIYSINELTEASIKFCKKINAGFLNVTFWIPPLIIKVSDLNQMIYLKISNKKLKIINTNYSYHLLVSSQELWTWWSKPYGTDSFVVGGHFELNTNKSFPLRIKLLFGLLTENHLDLKSLLKMIFNLQGIKFLINRREEIMALLFSKNFKFGTRK